MFKENIENEIIKIIIETIDKSNYYNDMIKILQINLKKLLKNGKNDINFIKNIFENKNFINIINKVENFFNSKINEFDENTINYDEIYICFIYIQFILKILYLNNEDLGLKNIMNKKILDIFTNYILLIKNYENISEEIDYPIFCLFLMKNGLVNYFDENIELIKPIKNIKLNYYDSLYLTKFYQTFDINIEKIGKENIDSFYFKINKIDKNIINPDSNIFIYTNNLNNFQDYIKINDSDCSPTKYITLPFDNQNNNIQFNISFPYQCFHTNLYGVGSNKNQSLGCRGIDDLNYIIPQKCYGLEPCRNLIDFKFGYYHTFVQSSDNNLYTCGSDAGSSFYEKNYKYDTFNLLTKFQDICLNDGGCKFISVNNYNASILLTNENNLYACGKNNEYCLGNVKDLDILIWEPYPLPPLQYKEKIKEIACGYKSTFLLTENGYGYSIGSNKFSQCGSSNINMGFYKEYFLFKPPKNVFINHVVAGEEFFIFLCNEGKEKINRLYSMGCYENGRCGVGTDNSNKFQEVLCTYGKEIKYINSRNDNTAVVSLDGKLYVFGSNIEGCLGLKHYEDEYFGEEVNLYDNYISEDVAISHNHLILICKEKKTNKRKLFSCGTNQYSSLALSENIQRDKKFSTLQEIKYFEENLPYQHVIKSAVSRYQSYFMTIETDLDLNCLIIQKKCELCQKEKNIKEHDEVIFYINKESKFIEFICNECFINNNSVIFDNKKYLFSTNIIFSNFFELLNKNLKNIKDKIKLDYINIKEVIKCKNCDQIINNYYYSSSCENSLILCKNCYINHCSIYNYPQLFYLLPLNIKISNLNPFFSEILYPNIKKNSSYYLDMDLYVNYNSKYYYKQILNNNKIKEIYLNFKKINFESLCELSSIKEDYEKGILNITEEEKNDLSNIDINLKKYELYQAILNIKNDFSENNIKYKNLIPHIINNKILYELLWEYNKNINQNFIKLITFSEKINDEEFYKIINKNLQILKPNERKNLFNYKLEKNIKNVAGRDYTITINRFKSFKNNNLLFIPEEKFNSTIFYQFFNQMRDYPLVNYLCRPDQRIVVIKLVGEGASDYGGPYRDIFSKISKEILKSFLCIPTPNNKNNIGELRDKYLLNPLANKKNNLDYYYFLGNLFAHCISSGNKLNLEFHEIIYKKILNINVEFEDFKTIDLTFYKFINDLKKIKNDEEFKQKFYDLKFVISSSNTENESEIELKENGKNITVNFENLNEFINLAKNFRINEFNLQLSYLRKGIIDIIPQSTLNLLRPEELEVLICGEKEFQLGILKDATEYQNYTLNDKIIKDFWECLEKMSNENKCKYLKFVWGRTTLPDPNINRFTHIIAKITFDQPDKRLPTSSTCYFTLNLPEYSSYEVLEKKLLYVINNCEEIDMDFHIHDDEYLEEDIE